MAISATIADSNNTQVVTATVPGAQGPAGGVATIDEDARADGALLFYNSAAQGGAGAYVATTTSGTIAGTFTLDGGTF